jgi:hypothetical protein
MKTQISAEKALDIADQLWGEMLGMENFIEDCDQKIEAEIDRRKACNKFKLFLQFGTTNPKRYRVLYQMGYDSSWRWSAREEAAKNMGLITEDGGYDRQVQQAIKLRDMLRGLRDCARLGDPIEITEKEATFLCDFL